MGVLAPLHSLLTEDSSLRPSLWFRAARNYGWTHEKQNLGGFSENFKVTIFRKEQAPIIKYVVQHHSTTQQGPTPTCRWPLVDPCLGAWAWRRPRTEHWKTASSLKTGRLPLPTSILRRHQSLISYPCPELAGAPSIHKATVRYTDFPPPRTAQSLFSFSSCDLTKMNIFQVPNWLKVVSNSYVSSPTPQKYSVCVPFN